MGLERYDDVLTVSIRGTDGIPLWRFMEDWLYIVGSDGGLIPFRMNWAQRRLYEEVCRQKLEGKPVRIIILKARQLGMSTLIEAMGFCLAMFNGNYRMAVMTDLEEHSKQLFGMCSGFYRNLNHSLGNEAEGEIEDYEEKHRGSRHPSDIRPALAVSRQGNTMVTASGNSYIKVFIAGEGTGRGSTLDFVHSSETGFQTELKKTNAALFSAVHVENPRSMIFVESTANGYNDFKTMWDEAVAGYEQGRNAFKPLFFPWFRNPHYVMDVKEGGLPVMEDWIYRKLKEHPEVTDRQAMWYWRMYTNGFTKELMLQEYPWCPEDSFISSGHSVFDMDKIKAAKDRTIANKPEYGEFTCDAVYSQDGMHITVSNVRWTARPGGSWKIYHHPVAGRPYACICDPNKGRGIDDSAIQVMDGNTAKQCAVFSDKDMDLDMVARQLLCSAIYYNGALLSSENNTGTNVLDWVYRTGYRRIYITQNDSFDDYSQNVTRRLGHSTTRGNRDKMINDFVIAFRDNPEMIEDYDTLCQMEAFSRVVNARTGKVKIEANSSAVHDDKVMSIVPFWTVRQQMDMRIDDSSEEDSEGRALNGIDDAMWAMIRKRRREESERSATEDAFGNLWD